MPQRFDTIPAKANVKPEPYTWDIPEQDVAEFKTLLKLSKIGPETFENTQSDSRLGISRQWLIQAKDVWETRFDWRHHEKRINALPNFITTVADPESGPLKIHFIGLFSTKSDAVPLLFLHGWPGSFLEFLSILELLKQKYSPDTLPYHVIVPSLPGYAASSGPPLDRDFGLTDVARILNQLMVDLGFGGGYVAQGGDIGSFLSRILSSRHDECKAFHTNVFVLPPNQVGDKEGLAERHVKKLERAQAFRSTGYGYALEHATRPATIGLALSTNPLALLAWIGEKFQEWVDEPLPLDTILASVTMYWFTSSFPRNIYSYRFILSRAGQPMPTSKEKPFGVSDFPAEIEASPEAWIKAAYPSLAFYRTSDKGGHFAALEQPEILLAHVEDFIKEVKSVVVPE